jgi:hypothetical protein
MTHKLEPTSDVHRRMHATSFLGDSMLEIGIAQQPVEAGFTLPERYCIPLLELLVVDTDFCYISWELTEHQLAVARNLLGEKAYRNRRLQVRFHDGSLDGAILLERELYGETGRWFVRLSQPGKLVFAELGYAHGETFHSFNSTGPVHIPRVNIVEPQYFEELEVSYGYGLHGRLLLLGINKREDSAWPEPLLPLPGEAEYVLPRLPALREHTAPGILPDSISSASLGASARPNSTFSIDLDLAISQDVTSNKGDKS